jgi:hypothetical protein
MDSEEWFMIDLPPENESMGDTNHFIQDLGFGCSGKAALHAVIQKNLYTNRMIYAGKRILSQSKTRWVSNFGTEYLYLTIGFVACRIFGNFSAAVE